MASPTEPLGWEGAAAEELGRMFRGALIDDGFIDGASAAAAGIGVGCSERLDGRASAGADGALR